MKNGTKKIVRSAPEALPGPFGSGRKKCGNGREVSAGHPGISGVCRRAGSDKGTDDSLQARSSGAGLCCPFGQFHAGFRQLSADSSWMDGVQGKGTAFPAADLLPGGEGTDQVGIPAAFGGIQTSTAAESCDPGDLRHRDPRFGTEILYGRGSIQRGDHRELQKQNPDDSRSGKTEEAAAELCKKERHPTGSHLYRPKRKATGPEQYMGTDEAAVYCGEGKSRQGISPQSAKALCQNILRPRKGHREIGRYSGPQQHRHHPDLYHVHRNGAPQKNRAAGIAVWAIKNAT